MSHILIVEDESVIRTALKRLLERNRYQVSGAESVDHALEQFDLDSFDLIISDLRLPGRPGTALIKLVSATPVLIMTSYASMRSAVDAMKMGAVDYIAKPFAHDELLKMVAGILANANAPSKIKTAPPRPENQKNRMIGTSQAMQELFKRIEKVAETDATVLIQGESGTGKELAACSIHEQSMRAKAPMISVNCAAIPETLIESELFGHEKGAFTGAVSSHTGLIEAADGGTLFLDEIGELTLEAQARLLRVLQEGEIRRVGSVTPQRVDVRLIAATHHDLKALTQAGRFREDLFYRLYIMEIKIPPLRARGHDIIELAKRKLDLACARMNRPVPTFNDAAVEVMTHYGWPGNVRELENAIERAIIMIEGNSIGPELLGLDMQKAQTPPYEDNTSQQHHSANSITPGAGKDNPALSLQDYFQRFVQENQEKMTETELARRLGISRKTLWERRQRLGIPRRVKSS